MYATILYHKNTIRGKRFTDQCEHDRALEEGWTTAPWTVNDPVEVKNPEVSAWVPIKESKTPARPVVERKKHRKSKGR